MAKTSPNVMSIESIANPDPMPGTKIGSVFCHLFLPYRLLFAAPWRIGKAGGLHIRRCQGLAVADYGCTLGALALKPSAFATLGIYHSIGYDGVNVK
jgi:hypothetical protein